MEKQEKRGGPRTGSGRPALSDTEKSKAVFVRLPAGAADTVKTRGPRWLRRIILEALENIENRKAI